MVIRLRSLLIKVLVLFSGLVFDSINLPVQFMEFIMPQIAVIFLLCLIEYRREECPIWWVFLMGFLFDLWYGSGLIGVMAFFFVLYYFLRQYLPLIKIPKFIIIHSAYIAMNLVTWTSQYLFFQLQINHVMIINLLISWLIGFLVIILAGVFFLPSQGEKKYFWR